MIRFLDDENFNGKILRGIRRQDPETDILRVQDTVIYQASDPKVLEWAAQQGRILLTHDIETIVKAAHERIAAGLPMSGVMAIRDALPIGKVVADLLIIAGASDMHDWDRRVVFLPL